MQNIIDELSERIREAGARKAALRIRGGGTKDFYGAQLRGDVLDTTRYSGIIDYEPTELVLTARAGTPLADIEARLREHGQMLAFEPPRFGPASTLGGCIAAGLSGPRRPYVGSARDHVLGVRMLDGKGTDLRFGGQVMKNVAGYDVARLMVGSLGTLGVLLEVSIKVLPMPPAEVTVRQEHTEAQAIELMNAWAGKPYPITGTGYAGGALYVRLSGAESAVRAAHARIGGEALPGDPGIWEALRDQRHAFFEGAPTLWRVSLKPTAAPLGLGDGELIEWGGALRWIAGDLDAGRVRQAAAQAGGHATRFRGGDASTDIFQPLPAPLLALHRRLMETFDPHGVLNPGRMYNDY